MNTVRFDALKLSGVAAAAALVVTGLTPAIAGPAISTPAVVAMSTDIALVSNAVLDDLSGIAAFDVPGTADAFDIAGLLNAEMAAVQGLIGSLISLPGQLISDVESMIGNATAMDFGLAFADLASIPQDIVNYLIGVPIAIGNTLYDMVAILPGEYLLNFG